MAGHFGVEKNVAILQKKIYWPKLRQDVSKYIRSCTSCAIFKPAIKKQGLYIPLPTLERPWESISMDYMLGLPPPSMAMIVYFWWLIGFRRWPFSQPARRESQWKILPSSSSNGCESILGYHRPSPQIGITGSSTHFGRVSGHCWTPSSLNTLLSTPKLMARQRSSIR
jgi:hypothetical protein